MQEFSEIEAKITLLSLSEQIALRDKLDERIESMVELSADHAERLQIEVMQRRLADFKSGKLPSKSWTEVRKELAAKYPL